LAIVSCALAPKAVSQLGAVLPAGVRANAPRQLGQSRPMDRPVPTSDRSFANAALPRKNDRPRPGRPPPGAGRTHNRPIHCSWMTSCKSPRCFIPIAPPRRATPKPPWHWKPKARPSQRMTSGLPPSRLNAICRWRRPLPACRGAHRHSVVAVEDECS
jgi:hypothetical protein